MARTAKKSTNEVVSHLTHIGRIDFDPAAVEAAHAKMVKELTENALAARGWTVAKGSTAVGYVIKHKGMSPIGGFYLNPDKTQPKAKAKAKATELDITPEQLKALMAILKG